MKKIFTFIGICLSMTVLAQEKTVIDSSQYACPARFNVMLLAVKTGNRIIVYTNDTTAISAMKSTYLLDSVTVDKDNNYTFYFPQKSETRIVTNLGGRVVIKNDTTNGPKNRR